MNARRFLGTLALLLTVTTVASAAPVTFTFDDVPATTIDYESSGPYLDRGLGIPYAGCMTTGVYTDSTALQAHSRPQFLAVSDQDICGGYLRMEFAAPIGPSAAVQFAIKGRIGTTMPPSAQVEAFDASGASIEVRTVALGDWQLVTFRPPVSRPIAAIEVTTAGTFGPVMLIDDVIVSRQTPRPSVTISSAPPATTEQRSSTIAFTANADTDHVVCSLDGAAAQPCSQRFTTTDDAVGAHSLKVTAIDVFGVADTTPSTVNWTVVAPPPTPTTPTTPLVPLAGALPPPACVGEPDSDHDGVSDACDTVGLPAGTPTIAGERASVAVLSGEVFIKLPKATGSRAREPRATRAGEPDPGYVPLKGVSVVPVDSTVDARTGAVSVITATGASDKGAPKQATSKVAAAIFQIRQRRALRKTKARRHIPPSPTDLILKNPEGAIQAAQCASAGSRGTVRSLSATIPKGTVRVAGFAAQVVAQQANTTVRVVDRCDGTFTEVGAGRARVTILSRGRTRTVKGGQSYFVPGNLLRVEGRKGR